MSGDTRQLDCSHRNAFTRPGGELQRGPRAKHLQSLWDHSCALAARGEPLAGTPPKAWGLRGRLWGPGRMCGSSRTTGTDTGVNRIHTGAVKAGIHIGEPWIIQEGLESIPSSHTSTGHSLASTPRTAPSEQQNSPV